MVENLFKKKYLQDFISSLNTVISTNESPEFITVHVIYNPTYTYKFQASFYLFITFGLNQVGKYYSKIEFKPWWSLKDIIAQ